MKITKNKRQLVLISCLSGSLLASLAIFSFKKPATIKNEIGETNLQNASVTEEKSNKKESKTPEDLRGMKEEDITKLPKYDSRDYGIVTPVKDQGFEGLCWAYALASASETSMLREGILEGESVNKSGSENKKYDNESLILSPASIDWVSNVRWGNADKLGLTPNDTFSRSLRSGFGIGRSAIAVMQWGAPTMMHERYESYDKQVAKLENIVQVIDEDSVVPNVSEVKKLVAKYGAVAFGYSFSGGSHGDYFNGSKNNAGGCSTSHHAATIVGWDDTVKKEQFNPQSSTDGAWIVKNSWGKDRFKEGYFYMSYDSRATDMVAVDYASNKDYQHNYYYDGLNLGIYPLSTSTDKHKYNELAAVFPVLKGTATEKEHLKGVNVSFKGKNVKVEVKVYKDPNPKNGSLDDISPELGQSQEVWSKTQTFDHPGSYTLKVEDDKKIELERGSYFSAVVKVTNDTNDAEVLVSQEFTYSNDLTYYKDADGKWKNCWDKNKSVARIKAFTTTEKVTSSAEDSKNVKYADVRFADYFYRYGDPLTDINPIVKVNNKNLIAKTDYDVSYTVYDSGVTNTVYNEASVGQVKVTITGKGEYKGETIKYIDMKVGLRPDLGSIGWYTENNKVIINANDKKGKKYSEITLPSGWEFVNPNITIGETSNNHLRYVDSKDSRLYRTTYFDVVSVGSRNSYKKDISQAAITATKSNIPATPDIKVSMTGVSGELQKDIDYSVDYFNIEHDCVRITIAGIGQNYFGKKEMIYAINSSDVQVVGAHQGADNNKTIVRRSLSSQESGKKTDSPRKVIELAITPKPVVEPEHENVKSTEEIVQQPVETEQVKTQDNTEVKTRQKRDASSNTRDISSATVSITSNGDVIYDGKEKQPEVKVQLHSTTLTKDVDYKVNYRDNINAGLAQIEIVGINNYSGKSFASFNIKKATPKVSALGVDSKGQVVATTNSDNHNVVYKYYTDASCTVEVTNPTKSGWYYVKTYVPETRNYSSYESTPSRVQLDSEKMMFNLQAPTTNKVNATKSNKLVIALSSVCAALVIAILVAIPLVVKKFKSRKG